MKKQYINKSAVVAEIERRLKELAEITKFSYETGLVDAYMIMRAFLETLEVKEVQHPSKDLEKAASQYQSVIRTISPQWVAEIEKAFIAGAKWMEQRLKDK